MFTILKTRRPYHSLVPSAMIYPKIGSRTRCTNSSEKPASIAKKTFEDSKISSYVQGRSDKPSYAKINHESSLKENDLNIKLAAEKDKYASRNFKIAAAICFLFGAAIGWIDADTKDSINEIQESCRKIKGQLS